MKLLIFAILLMLTSCGTKKTEGNDFRECYECTSDLSKYKDFSYKFIDKKVLTVISNDTIYNADIIVTIAQGEPQRVILMDSVLCYCLAICKTETVANARFYRDIEGYEVALKNNLTSFSRENIFSITNGSINALADHLICSFKVNELDIDWETRISSNNLTVPFLRKIRTSNNKDNVEQLIIK